MFHHYLTRNRFQREMENVEVKIQTDRRRKRGINVKKTKRQRRRMRRALLRKEDDPFN